MLKTLRRWGNSYTEQGRYSPVGIAFHWIMAGLVIFQLLYGWTMERYLVGGDRIAAYALHSHFGLSILLLAVLRFVWRLLITDPINDADAPGWQSTVAHATHVVFYFLFALLPLSGWIMWSAIQPAEPLFLAGLVPVPPMPFHDLSPGWQQQILAWSEDAHLLGIIGLMLLVPLHIGAALKHHFWNRHDVLEGILPEVPDDYSHPEGKRYSPRRVQSRAREVEG